jgi:hypothetical protein
MTKTKLKAFAPLGDGPLFPGKKYKPKSADRQLNPRGTPELIRRLSVELGSDHPKIKMLKKDLGPSEPYPFPEKK